MNPDLAKLWQNVVTAHTAAKAAGDSLSSDDIDQYLQSESKGKYSLKDITGVSAGNLGRSFVQGATSNFADELASGKADPTELAGIKAGGNAAGAMMGVPYAGDLVSKARELTGWLSDKLGGSKQVQEDMRLRGNLFHEAQPVMDTGVGMAGGILPFMLAPEAEAASVGSSMARGALAGTGAGALAGAGAGEDAASRVSGAAIGGVTGGVLGGVLSGAVSGVKYLNSPERQAARALRATLGDDDLAPHIADFLSTGKSTHPMLADMTPALRAALKAASAKAGPNVAADLASTLAERQAGAPARLAADAAAHTTSVTGNAPADATTAMMNMNEATGDWAKSNKGYGGLNAQLAAADPNGVSAVPNIRFPQEASEADISRLAYFKSMLEQEAASAAAKGEPAHTSGTPLTDEIARLSNKVGANLNPTEKTMLDLITKPALAGPLKDAQRAGLITSPFTPSDAPTLTRLIEFKNKIGALARKSAGQPGGGSLAQDLIKAEQTINSHLASNVPGYSAVADHYGYMKGMAGDNNLPGMTSGVQGGVDLWTSADPAFLDAMKQMDPSQTYAVRYGLASELAAKLRAAEGGQKNMAAAFKNGTLAHDDVLKVLFGDKDTFNSMMKHVDLEDMMAQTKAASPPAPPTNDPGAMTMKAGASGLATSTQFLKGAALRAMTGAGLQRYEQRAGEAMTNMLQTRGTPAIDALLEQLRNPSALTGGMSNTLAPAAAGAMAGRMQQP